eukprot:gene5527-3941_t
MLRWWSLLVLVLYLHLGCLQVAGLGKINIALHAQVLPDDKEKIVGSVITTDGLRRAFAQRPYVNNVTVFYPSAYEGFFDVPWDYIIIEGWFPSIRDFIANARNHAPAVRVVFFCLDPSYPGLDHLLALDFDGVMTNSETVLELLRQLHIPGSLQLLAADTDVMRPRPDVARSVATAYVGAGGHMLVVKPALKTMLEAAKDVGLHLYGTGWGADPELRDVWRGTLPRYDLAQAYARADVVLASTIKSQDDFGMINNRIFEALSCGALVLSEYSLTLERAFGDVLSFFNASKPVTQQLQRLLALPPDEAARRRQRARQRIEQEHTWLHRVVSMENFLFHLPLPVAPRPTRRHPLRALVISAPRLVRHIDYQHLVEAVLLPYMEAQGMHVTRVVAEEQWRAHAAVAAVETFHVVVAVCSAFDDVDRWMQVLPFPLHVQQSPLSPFASTTSTGLLTLMSDRGDDPAAFAVVQKRGLLLLGIDADGARQCREEYTRTGGVLPPCGEFARYDTIFHRSAFEIDRVRALFPSTDDGDGDDDLGDRCIPRDRTQHLMGLRNDTTLFLHGNTTKQWAVFVCFWAHRQLCRRSFVERDFAVYAARFRDELDGGGGGVNAAAPLQPMLVLVGGPSLAAFVAGLPPDDRLVDATSGAAVARVVHWADGTQRRDVLELLLHATVVVQFYLPDTRGGGGGEDVTTATTTEDVLVLLAAAALGQVRVHLLGHHEHFLRIAQAERPAVWNGDHLALMLRNGFNRLLGVAATRARVQAQLVGVHWDATAQRWHFDDPHHPLATAAFQLDFLTTTVTLQYQRPFLLLQTDDGPVMCLLRPMALVVVVFDELPPRHDAAASASATDASTANDGDRLWLAMRGSMFGNFHQPQSLPLRFATLDIVGAPPKPPLVEYPAASASASAASWKWSLPSPRDDVFVYVYRRPGSY